VGITLRYVAIATGGGVETAELVKRPLRSKQFGHISIAARAASAVTQIAADNWCERRVLGEELAILLGGPQATNH
jgi:hypothetical protein